LWTIYERYDGCLLIKRWGTASVQSDVHGCRSHPRGEMGNSEHLTFQIWPIGAPLHPRPSSFETFDRALMLSVCVVKPTICSVAARGGFRCSAHEKMTHHYAGKQPVSMSPLQYAWVDTRCVDKKSGAELGEAISCMYSW
jgi:hypothetical protein